MCALVPGLTTQPQHLEEMMAERGVSVDHATIHRWVIKLTPVLASALRSRKRSVCKSWRMDETYIQINTKWHDLYRGVDKAGQTVDFYLSEKRDRDAVRTFFEKAIDLHGTPKKIDIDGSTANKAAVLDIAETLKTPICLRQIKYLKTGLNKITAPSSASSGPCWGSRHTEQHRSSWLALKPCT